MLVGFAGYWSAAERYVNSPQGEARPSLPSGSLPRDSAKRRLGFVSARLFVPLRAPGVLWRSQVTASLRGAELCG